MAIESVKVYPDNIGSYEVIFNRMPLGDRMIKGRRLIEFGYYLWLSLFFYILACTILYIVTRHHQYDSPFVEATLSDAISYMGWILFPITDYWNVIIRSFYTEILLCIIFVLAAWRLYISHREICVMKSHMWMLKSTELYNDGLYKEALVEMKKLQDHGLFLTQEQTGNLIYLYRVNGMNAESEDLLAELLERDKVIVANNIRRIDA